MIGPPTGVREVWRPDPSHTRPRKANLGGLRPAVGFEITFDDEQTTFKRVDVADVADLAGHLSIRQRMVHLLRHGAMNPAMRLVAGGSGISVFGTPVAEEAHRAHTDPARHDRAARAFAGARR